MIQTGDAGRPVRGDCAGYSGRIVREMIEGSLPEKP